MVKFGTYHSQNFVWKRKPKPKKKVITYSEKYIQEQLSMATTSKDLTNILLRLYRDAPDVWKKAIKQRMQRMVAMGKIDKGDIPKLQMCGGFGLEYSGKGGQCSLKL